MFDRYVKFGILLTFVKHLHDRIISVREEICALKTSLTLPLIEVTVRARKVSGHVFVFGVSNLPL